jgi:hypothetical protein
MKSEQRTVTPKEEATILGLIAEEAKALNAGQHKRAISIREKMMQEYAGILCLVCGHEAHLHSPTMCLALEGGYVCDCPGIKLRKAE